jgi:DNA-3-methyladenine glycosylase II
MPTPDHYNIATAFLSAIDDDWMQLIQHIGPCQLVVKPEREPYEALIRAIAYQQLHAKAGDAIINRLCALHTGRFPTPEILLATDFDTLRLCGFSARKINTLKEIANGALTGSVPSRNIAEKLSDEALIASLTTLKGIGRWTVEMLLIFTLERLDVFPADDFGIAQGYMRLKKLNVAPKPKALNTLSLAWQPYRTVASWYLWRVPK